MTQHLLKNRAEKEVLWFQRRDTLKAAAAWAAMGGLPAAVAQQRSNIVELTGDALVNGVRLLPERTLQTGDQIQTGPGSSLVFAIGNASFRVRQNTLMTVERGATLGIVSLLRIVTGGVVSVWSKGNSTNNSSNISNSRAIITPTLTAGIRGTGVYTEVLPQQNGRTYFCNCYGTVDLDAGGSRAQSQSDYHQSFWADAEEKNGSRLSPAKFLDHTDEELEFLARLIEQRTYWQIVGRKGTADGKGRMGY
ncbi:MAG: iron dicitrate transport regulator FecR [Polaromonas sp.]|nr:MAG: iron dicitrate transport regulator FecR [Polaromonas sp.]